MKREAPECEIAQRGKFVLFMWVKRKPPVRHFRNLPGFRKLEKVTLEGDPKALAYRAEFKSPACAEAAVEALCALDLKGGLSGFQPRGGVRFATDFEEVK